MQSVVYTNKGLLRENNEDSYLVKDDPFPLIAVADGMGGHNAGEVASKMAVDLVDRYALNFAVDLFPQIEEMIKNVNIKIYYLSRRIQAYSGMGTTLSLGIIYQMNLYIGHVGDSRIYLFRDNSLQQLTRDHSLVNELLEQNKISFDEAFDHPQKHIITQALGTQLSLRVEAQKIPLKEGDLLLFCSDGLSDMVKYNSLEMMFKDNHDINKLSTLLGAEAMNNGGNDNITLIICKMG